MSHKSLLSTMSTIFDLSGTYWLLIKEVAREEINLCHFHNFQNASMILFHTYCVLLRNNQIEEAGGIYQVVLLQFVFQKEMLIR